MSDLEQRLREAFREDARQARLVNPDGPLGRGDRVPSPHRGTRLLVAAAILVVVGVVGVLLIRDGDEGDREVTTTPGPTEVDGSIVTGAGEGWPAGAAAPERPDSGMAADPYQWDDYDAVSGSFLYVAVGTAQRIVVLDADGDQQADIDCGRQFCARGAVLGPGDHEVTVPVQDPSQDPVVPTQLQVLAWDGTGRDTIDISIPVSGGARTTSEQRLEALAWSPDGTRLAVATVPGLDCDPSSEPCGAQVWTFDRHGGQPQLVHSAPDTVEGGSWLPPEVGDLAWSPDGRSVGVVVAPQPLGDPVWPRLVVLRFRPNRTVLSDTLYHYDRGASADSYLMQMWYEHTFPFAWSPDGARIAVTGEDGVEEISSDDGRVLARHPGLGLDDEGHAQDLAWLPAS